MFLLSMFAIVLVVSVIAWLFWGSTPQKRLHQFRPNCEALDTLVMPAGIRIKALAHQIGEQVIVGIPLTNKTTRVDVLTLTGNDLINERTAMIVFGKKIRNPSKSGPGSFCFQRPGISGLAWLKFRPDQCGVATLQVRVKEGHTIKTRRITLDIPCPPNIPPPVIPPPVVPPPVVFDVKPELPSGWRLKQNTGYNGMVIDVAMRNESSSWQPADYFLLTIQAGSITSANNLELRTGSWPDIAQTTIPTVFTLVNSTTLKVDPIQSIGIPPFPIEFLVMMTGSTAQDVNVCLAGTVVQ